MNVKLSKKELLDLHQAEGIVSGGGTALIRSIQDLTIDTENDEQELGVNIVLESAFSPIRQMAFNAGESADLIIKEVKESDVEFGYDFRGRKMVNMIDNGIVDPVKVTRCALQNAISVAGTLITTNHAIVQV